MSKVETNPMFSVPDSPVKEDFIYFLEILPVLLKKYRGKWLVISARDHLVKPFDTEGEAVSFAFRSLTPGEFIIQKCEEQELCMQTFHSPEVI